MRSSHGPMKWTLEFISLKNTFEMFDGLLWLGHIIR